MKPRRLHSATIFSILATADESAAIEPEIIPFQRGREQGKSARRSPEQALRQGRPAFRRPELVEGLVFLPLDQGRLN
jgi:hypothetical protein